MFGIGDNFQVGSELKDALSNIIHSSNLTATCKTLGTSRIPLHAPVFVQTTVFGSLNAPLFLHKWCDASCGVIRASKQAAFGF